jgi:hypothetical protein
VVGYVFAERPPDELAQTLFVFEKLAVQDFSNVWLRRAAHHAITSLCHSG